MAKSGHLRSSSRPSSKARNPKARNAFGRPSVKPMLMSENQLTITNMIDYFIDRDPSPKSFPCRKCGRDVQSGKHCICVPSMPLTVKPKDENPPPPFVVRA